MKKIPFEATFTGAYKFLFFRLFSILGTVWFPTLVFGLITAGVLYLVIPHGWWSGQFPVLDEKHPDPAAVWAILVPFFTAFVPIMLVLVTMDIMLTVGLMQLALGQRKRCFIYFSMGADFWRYLGICLLAFLVLMLMYLLLIAAFILGAIFLGPLIGKGWNALVLVLTVTAAIVFWIYSVVRLTFFLPAVSVAEHQVNLGRSWELAAGNWWRIVGVSLLVGVPPLIVSQVLQEILVVSPLFTNVAQLAEKTHDFATLLHAAFPLLGAFLGILLLQNAASYALMAGATAKAYFAVTGTDEAAS